MKLLANPPARPAINNYLQGLDEHELAIVVEYIRQYFRQFLAVVSLPTPWFIVLDNALLQDLRLEGQKPDRMLRARALKCLFHYLRAKLPPVVYLAVTPVTLFEYNGRLAPRDEQEFVSKVNEIDALLEQLGLPVLRFRLGSFEEARDNVERLQWDTDEITRALGIVKSRRYDVPIKQGPYISFPLDLAYELIPRDLLLRFLDPGYVNFVLASIIKEWIWESPVQPKELRKKFRGADASSAYKLAKVEGGKLKGLGDLQILGMCSIRNQFMSRSHVTFVALTSDETLDDLLIEFSNHSLSSGDFQSGDPRNEQKSRRFVDEMRIQHRLVDLQNSFWREFHGFMHDLVKDLLDDMAEVGEMSSG